MTLPLSGSISMSQINGEFGYGNGLNSYRGMTWWTDAGSTGTFPSGQISYSDFWGKRKTAPYKYRAITVGSLNVGLLMGAESTGGGNAEWSLYANVDGDTGTPAYIYNTELGTYWSLSAGSLANSYFPLIPTIYTQGTNGIVPHRYSLGTCRISPAYDLSNVPIFVWRSLDSYWTNDMIKRTLGLTSAQVAQVKNAERVAWGQTTSGMDDLVYYGMAVLSSNSYDGGAGPWYSKSITEYFYNYEFGDQWEKHGFDYTPTVTFGPNNTSYSLSNTGTGAFTKTGRTDRDSGGVIGNLSDYTILLDRTSLVVPLVKTNTGFSGGAWNGARNPFQATFNYIEKYVG